MPIRRGFFGGAVNLLPTVTIGATTSVTESRAVFNATVSTNSVSTTVTFQYNTTNNFTSYTEVTATQSPVTGQSTAVSYTVTGLTKVTTVDAVRPTYYVRCVVTNSSGTATSSVTSFDLWTLRQAIYSTAGLYSLTVPTVAGVIPAPLPLVLLIGGGGGGSAFGGGGGGGGLLSRTNYAFTGPSGVLNIGVGSGGAAGVSSGNLNGTNGLSSDFGGTNIPSLTAGGGQGGFSVGGNGGNVGTGDNPAYTGGTGYVSTAKFGPTYGGGGAGGDGNGGSANSSTVGTGGPGNGLWGNSGGGGGGTILSDPIGAHGQPDNVGAGGNAGKGVIDAPNVLATAGKTGVVLVQYYGT